MHSINAEHYYLKTSKPTASTTAGPDSSKMPKKKGKEAQKSLVEQQDKKPTRNEEAPTLPNYKTLVHRTPNSIDWYFQLSANNLQDQPMVRRTR